MACLQYTPTPPFLRDTPNAPAPPSVCNTRAQNSLGVDYVALTSTGDRLGRVFCSLFGIPMEEWEELPHGGHLYKHCRKWGNVRVYYDGMEGMGSYCQVSGQACRELEAAGVVTDWQEFAHRCLEVYGLKCRRLDVFIDDREGLLDMDELERKLEDQECATHAREYQRPGKKVIGMRGQRKGDTIYIGSGKSDSFMRIYNKTLELRPKGRKIDDWCREHGHHIRVELELRRKRAGAAMKRLSQVGLESGLVQGLIRSFIDFKVSDASGHNGSRLPTWEPWERFLSSASKVKLATAAEQSTLPKVLYYHDKQYAPTLAVQCMALGGDEAAMFAWFMGLVREGQSRMRPKHYRMLQQAVA